jgi:hypothetical protein
MIAPDPSPEPLDLAPQTLPEQPPRVLPAESPAPIVVAPPSLMPRPLPPALEPLSSFEGETDSDSPGWMASFTIGRAITIMLFLTLVAGSFVYHRELGRALIWLGQQIAGDDSPAISKITPPSVPPAPPANPEPSLAASSEKTPAVIPPAPADDQPKSVALPRASENTPLPQLKETKPGSLIASSQIAHSPNPTPPVDSSAESGQLEYQQATQILHSPNQEARLPDAVRLLWSAVEKGHIGAEIALAELYRQGRGVTKNCLQTRILLSAAARKGSAEAQKRLQEFLRAGCAE